jgi:hypothetical protein
MANNNETQKEKNNDEWQVRYWISPNYAETAYILRDAETKKMLGVINIGTLRKLLYGKVKGCPVKTPPGNSTPLRMPV